MSKNGIAKEITTVNKMISLYCRHNHKKVIDCEECLDLREYVYVRLQKCPFGDKKPVCSKCEIHCYKPEMREKIKGVMRYAGPRMIVYHPVEFFRYLGRKFHR